MATFYLLPPRACLDEALGGLLSKLLPGLPLPVDTWDTLIDRLASAGSWPDDVYLVPRDDLPEGQPPADALVAAFGAEPGDRVIEVSLGGAGIPACDRVQHRQECLRHREPGGVSALVLAR